MHTAARALERAASPDGGGARTETRDVAAAAARVVPLLPLENVRLRRTNSSSSS
jgi:hypothetical protein